MPSNTLGVIAMFLLALGIAGGSVGIVYSLYQLATLETRRRARERIVVGQLAAIMAQDVPLTEGLRAAAGSECGIAAKRLTALADATARGEPLNTALRFDVPECSGMTRSLVQAGQRTQQLPRTLALAEQALIERDLHDMRVGRGAVSYVVIILLFTAFIVSMLMVVIIPKYEEIFVDFDTTLPPLTISVINSTRSIARLSGLIVMVLLIIVPLAAYLHIRARRPESPRWTSEIADTIRWFLPGLGKLQFARGLALAFRTMRLAVRSGVPLADAAEAAAELDVNVHLRDRLHAFAAHINAGADAGQAARRAQLGKISVMALSTARYGGRLEDGLRYAADYHEAMISRWCIAARQCAWPLCTLALATLVATVVLAMFLPLIRLIGAVET